MDSSEFVLDDDAEQVWTQPETPARLANGTIAPPLPEAVSDDEADVLEREARWPELIELLLERSETVPGATAQLRLLHRIASIYEHEIGDVESAFTVMQAAFERDARDTLTAREMVRLAEAASQWDESISALRHLAELETEPENKSAVYIQLAEAIELHHRDLDAATGAYEEALVHDLGSIDALEALTRLYRYLSAWRPLAETLARRTAFAPDDAEQLKMWLEVGALWEHQVEDPGEAIQAYRNAIALDPANLGALRALEGLYEGSSQHERYVEMLEAELAASESDAERVSLYQRLAVATEERLGDFARAARAYEQLLAIDPHQHDAYASLAELHARTGNLDALVATYHDHLAARPDLATQIELCIALGKVYETQLHDVERAISSYEDAVTIGGDARPALEGLARLYEATGAWTRAVDVLDRFVDQTPELHCRIGRIQAVELGDADSAAASFERALDIAPGHLPAIDALIVIHEQRGEWHEAVEMMARAEAQLPLAVDKVRLAFAAGTIYHRELGDDARARERFATVISLDPEHVDAGRPLAEMYFAASAWRELFPVIEMLCRKLGARDAELFYRAARCAAELGDVPRALGHYKTAYELDPTHLPTITGRADLLFRTEDWATAAKLYQTLVTEQHGDEWAIIESYYRLGAIRKALGDRKKALAMFDQALALAPHHRDALAASVELRGQLGEWDAVVEGKLALLATTDDAADQIRLHTEIGAIYQDKLQNTRQAAKSYVEALMVSPENHQLLQKLLDLCIDSKQWRKALEVIERFVALEQDPFKRGLYYHAAGTLCRDELAALDEAVDHYNSALDSFFAQPERLDDQQLPRALKSFEAIDKILTTKRDWKAQEHAYRAMIHRLPKDGRFFQMHVGLVDALAEIYRSRLKQFDAATSAFELAQQMDPDNKLRAGADRAEILAELYVMAGPDRADKAVEQHARVLRREPFNYDAYHALARIYEATNQYDKRWCVCNALKFLRRATPDELEFADQHTSPGFTKAHHAMTAQSWAKLAHPDENRFISAILGACSRGVSAVKAFPLKDFGLKKEERRDLANDPLMFSKLFLHLARVLDVQVPDVYLVEDHKPIDIQLANSDSPAFVVRPQQLHGKSEREVAYLLTRRLAFMRPEYYLRMLLPTNTELKVVVLAAIVMVQPNFPVPPNMVAPIQAYLPELRKRMPAGSLEQLGALVHQFVQSTPELDLAKWSHAVDAAAHRASFAMCGELDTAARAIVAEPVAVDGPTSKDKIKQLVLFAVSEDYFAIRAQLGLTIG